jgi:hypothetical protein
MHEHSDKHLQEGMKKKSIVEIATSLTEQFKPWDRASAEYQIHNEVCGFQIRSDEDFRLL